MKYTTWKDVENINKIGHEMKQSIHFSWTKLATATGWSTTTVRKYYDETWFPGKYYKEPIATESLPKDLEYPGLYMLAQQIVENNEIINLIKIGKASNLRKRLASYRGTNPFAKCIATKHLYIGDLDKEEKFYHQILGLKNRRYGNTEWFICDDEQFKYLMEKKFN